MIEEGRIEFEKRHIIPMLNIINEKLQIINIHNKKDFIKYIQPITIIEILKKKAGN